MSEPAGTPSGPARAPSAPAAAAEAPLQQLTARARVVICAGPGGVGKTTAAAALALQVARQGRRACVVTIDPARRLADALGVEALTNEPHLVETGGTGAGELWALMLDTKSTFDTLVRRYAPTPEQAGAILDNRFYRNISSALSGTQEYMAVEKLYELYEDDRYDLIVVDTPPTRQALDFIDAPRRLIRFLNNRIFRLLMMPTRAGLRAMNVATQLFLRTVARVVGGEVVQEAVAFFTAFEGMEQGFRERTRRVEALLASDETAFVLVTAPRAAATTEASFFADRLSEASLRVGAVVVNRVLPRFGPLSGEARGKGAAGVMTSGWGALLSNLEELDRMAASEDRHVRVVAQRAGGAPVVCVPFLTDEVHDLTGLAEVGRHLFGAGG